jgi:hypothetical protein
MADNFLCISVTYITARRQQHVQWSYVSNGHTCAMASVIGFEYSKVFCNSNKTNSPFLWFWFLWFSHLLCSCILFVPLFFSILVCFLLRSKQGLKGDSATDCELSFSLQDLLATKKKRVGIWFLPPARSRNRPTSHSFANFSKIHIQIIPLHSFLLSLFIF